ncbi:ATP-binding protein [Nitrosomonas sp.]|uniref:ATP-binding protein n=1 Tax=Nitrosomonas sp. TaxID=42353 RepID=UPI0025E62389|nr:ATP-binding protein [Nitrosomonas sp.]
MKFIFPDIRHDQSGFQALVRLENEASSYFLDDVEIDMNATTWFDADMCAAFGAILYRLSDNLNTIRLTNICSSVEKILSKNGFLSHYGREKIPDRWGTTIPYRRFDVKDDRYFADYIENELIHRAEMPAMSHGLLKKFRESIFEIFSNAVLHSNSELGIFSCGQFFPNRQRLDFSVADLGVGMRQNIQDNTGLILSAEDAIHWSTEGRNTTKRGPIPGGLGLKLLREFIDLNGGCIQIVSDAGYWRRENKKTITAPLNYPFPGTVVTVEINTADTNSYKLVSEPSAANIF